MDKYWRWRGLLLLAGLVSLIPVRGLAIQTTNVQGIVYRADGSRAQGTMLISWPPFTAADGSTVAAGNSSVTIAPDGSVSMGLTPNVGANPQGTYYTVVYHLNDGTVQKEYWVVPQTATATISEMRARVVPAAVAQQSVSQQYVDTSIGALQGSYLQLKGGTMNGVLKLSGDPTDALQAATKGYVDAHVGSGGAALPHVTQVIGGKGDGNGVSLAEEGVNVSGTTGTVAWKDDLNAGVYDPRDPRWGAQDTPAHQAAAIQAMSNQMACDLSMGVVKQAHAKFPQGNYAVDNLMIAPGANWEGISNSSGGTNFHSFINNHQLMTAPFTMTVTCSDGNPHTDTVAGTRVARITLTGCANGGCSNAPGDTGSYATGGPNSNGLRFQAAGVVEYVTAQYFGGYGVRNEGQDAKLFHITLYSNLEWYYFGGYKGVHESVASPESSAVTTGTTGSVALSWTAVTGATGYVVYRGSTAGGESAVFLTSTNSFTDTGAAGTAGSVSNAVTQTTAAAPGTITPTPSTTGGTLAAGTHYYKVTSTTADAWHGSIEFAGLDNMADWIEAYGLFDPPTAFTYHHMADILGGGGYAHFDHLWPQLGLVGIAQPFGAGPNDMFENIRVDFTRQEGVWFADAGLQVNGGVIDGSCTSPNSVTINTGQDGHTPAGICNQAFTIGNQDLLTNLWLSDNNGFGATVKTADVFLGGGSYYHDLHNSQPQNLFQLISGSGLISGANWEPSLAVLTNVTGPTPNMAGLFQINPTDASPINYTGFMNVAVAQDFYVKGGNSNVTLKYDSQYLVTCSKQDINLGTVAGFLHFRYTNNGIFGLPAWVAQVCDGSPSLSLAGGTMTGPVVLAADPTANLQAATKQYVDAHSGGTASILASSETVSFSATPTFATTTRASMITLTANVTSFTLGAGAGGQEKTLTFCQNATGGFTVASPPNVHGFFTVGTTANKCSSQHFTYSTAQSAWLADSPGVTNE